jgi:hypothetical protein
MKPYKMLMYSIAYQKAEAYRKELVVLGLNDHVHYIIHLARVFLDINYRKTEQNIQNACQ